jgi:DnaK suppressor protein
MAREEALLRLHKTLLARRDDLRKKLTEELANLRDVGADSSGDSADAAFDAGSDEMSSQLAEFDSRELGQIERALVRLKQGSYGACEICNKKIPIGRLNALPYSTCCIECQRELERHPDWASGGRGGNWENVVDHMRQYEDQPQVRLSDLEIESSGR